MTMDSQFDTAVAAYESSMEVMPFREHVEAYSFLNAVGDICGRDVLDLGCGSGLYARQLRRAGAARAVGMDESAPMVEHAQRREEHEGLGVEYVAANAADPTAGYLPGITGSFDVVTAVYVLPYASSPEALEGFCATARRALRATGGRFVAAVLNPEFSTDPEWYRGYGMLLSSQQSPAEGTPGHLRAWVGPEVLDLDFFRWSAAAHERAPRGGRIRPRLVDPPDCLRRGPREVRGGVLGELPRLPPRADHRRAGRPRGCVRHPGRPGREHSSDPDEVSPLPRASSANALPRPTGDEATPMNRFRTASPPITDADGPPARRHKIPQAPAGSG